MIQNSSEFAAVLVMIGVVIVHMLELFEYSEEPVAIE